jgi:capsular polysaccharide export protein
MRILFSLGTKPWPGYRDGVAAFVAALSAQAHEPVVVSRTGPDAEWFADNVEAQVEKYDLQRMLRLPLSTDDLADWPGIEWAQCREAVHTLLSVGNRVGLPESAASHVYGATCGAVWLLHRHLPDAVIVYNPYWLEHRPLVGAARALGIPVFYYEKGMLPRSFQLDERGINAESSLAVATEAEPADPARVERELKKLRDELFGEGETGWSQPAGRVGAENLRERLAVERGRRILLYVGQVNSDTNMTEFSPHFDSNREAVAFLTELLPADSDWFVLGKKHPKGDDRDAEMRRLLAGRGTWAQDVHLHDCLDLADCVVSINSSVVLEALLKHRHVVLLGRGIFNGKGVAYEYDDLNHEEMWRAFSRDPMKPPADAEKIDYWCWRATCRWLYRCRPQDLPGEGRRAADYVLERLTGPADVHAEDVLELLPPLVQLVRRRLGRPHSLVGRAERAVRRLLARFRSWTKRRSIPNSKQETHR